MSSVFVQIGQGGNQLGETFFNTVLPRRFDEDKKKNRCPPFQFSDYKFRSVNVDSEQKVINQLRKNPFIRDENLISGLKGCASNWAKGFYGSQHSLLCETLRVIQKESDRCECFTGIVVLHSISGGTGSGFGSCLIKALRDEFPHQNILSCVILPHSSGETPLQNYNNLLSLSSLQKYSDGIVVLPNDVFLSAAATLQKHEASSNTTHCSLQDVNKEMSSALAGFLYPTDTLATENGYNLGREPWQLIQEICPLPTFKFISISHQQKRHLSWEKCVNSLQRSFNINGIKFKSIANVVVARGENQSYDFSQCIRKLQNQTESFLGCVQWSPDPIIYWTANRNLPGKKSSTLTTASNHSQVIHWLETTLEKAQVMYSSQAYLHWYWKYGADKNDFEEAFETIKTVVENYKQLG